MGKNCHSSKKLKKGKNMDTTVKEFQKETKKKEKSREQKPISNSVLCCCTVRTTDKRINKPFCKKSFILASVHTRSTLLAAITRIFFTYFFRFSVRNNSHTWSNTHPDTHTYTHDHSLVTTSLSSENQG